MSSELTLAQALFVVLTLTRNVKSAQRHLYAVLSRRSKASSLRLRPLELVHEQKLTQAIDTLAFFLSTGSADASSYALSITPLATKVHVHVAADPPDASSDGLLRLNNIWTSIRDIALAHSGTGQLDVVRGEAKDLARALFSSQVRQISSIALEKQAQHDDFLTFVDVSSPTLDPQRRGCLESLRLLALVSGQLTDVSSSSPDAALDTYAQYSALHAQHRISVEQGIITWKNTWLFKLQTEFNRRPSASQDDDFIVSDFARLLLEPINKMLVILEVLAIPKYRQLVEKEFECIAVTAPEPTTKPGMVALSPNMDVRQLLEGSFVAEQQRLADLAQADPDSRPLAQASQNCSAESQDVVSEFISHLQSSVPQPGTAPHPECILLYHHGRAAQAYCEPSFSYFGLNKPTCFGCALYLQAYNIGVVGRADPDDSIPSTEYRTRTNGRDRVFICAFPSEDPPSQLDSQIRHTMMSGIKEVLGSIICEKAIRLKQISMNK